MKVKIRLDTMKDIQNFVKITISSGAERIVVTDGNGMVVNAKSVLGMMYAMEFDELYCESDKDIYTAIKDFVIE
ncbi:MAG: hypothetical protein KBT31_04155 [Firmicutes bacterium]|nr:hypothetical protein [Candidatus Colimorpha enterica]